MSGQSAPSFLILVVDTDYRGWNSRVIGHDSSHSTAHYTSFSEFVKCLIIFVNSYLLLNRKNRLVILSFSSQASTVIYPDLSLHSGQVGVVSRPLTVGDVITTRLLEAYHDSDTTDHEDVGDLSSLDAGHRSYLTQALSRALCILHRHFLSAHGKSMSTRIACVQVMNDDTSGYNQIMNSIFSAQKLGTVIDGLVLSKVESSFLQQACSLTNGIYVRPPDQRSLLQLLLTHYLPDPVLRVSLLTPMLKSVDLRASCFCHRKPVDCTYLCSVCLAMVCEEPEVCATCGSRKLTPAGAAEAR